MHRLSSKNVTDSIQLKPYPYLYIALSPCNKKLFVYVHMLVLKVLMSRPAYICTDQQV